MSDVTQPHRALVTIKIEIHDVLKTGEFSGQPVNLKGLPEYELKPLNRLQIDGYDLDNCLRKVKDAIERFKGNSNA